MRPWTATVTAATALKTRAGVLTARFRRPADQERLRTGTFPVRAGTPFPSGQAPRAACTRSACHPRAGVRALTFAGATRTRRGADPRRGGPARIAPVAADLTGEPRLRRPSGRGLAPYRRRAAIVDQRKEDVVHAAAQHQGDRDHQCDAAATYTAGGRRAYAVLDGIGSTVAVRDWTRATARRLARAAALHGATSGLSTIVAAERDRPRGTPSAVAVVATVTSDGVEIAWCGDARAYLLTEDGRLHRLTRDHNLRQAIQDMGAVPPPGSRNLVLSCIGSRQPVIGTATAPAAGTLLLASDGAYEPVEDAGLDLGAYLTDPPRAAARRLVTAAVEHAIPHRADNATALVVDVAAAVAALST